MSVTAWAVMLGSNVAVIVAMAWCFHRILMLPPVESETLHGQPAIDTRDTTEAD